MLGVQSGDVAMSVHTSQQDQRVYCITLRGQIDQEFVEAYCPVDTALACEGETAVLANIHAAQSGIVGLTRQPPAPAQPPRSPRPSARVWPPAASPWTSSPSRRSRTWRATALL